jgi:thioredoxin 1
MTITKRFSSLQDLITSAKIPVLVSFYSNQCGYCQQFAPILENVKTQMGDRVLVVKVNSDKYPKLLAEYEIKALPTSLLFVERELASRIKGVMKTSDLVNYLNQFL